MLHYGLVVTALLLLNQRTWGHHATLLLIADVGIWQGVGFGRMTRSARAWALGFMISGAVVIFSTTSGAIKGMGELLGQTPEQADILSDVVTAYGPMFFHFVFLLGTGVLLSVILRGSQPPYAVERQKLLG